jgi:hypothetical protein
MKHKLTKANEDNTRIEGTGKKIIMGNKSCYNKKVNLSKKALMQKNMEVIDYENFSNNTNPESRKRSP